MTDRRPGWYLAGLTVSIISAVAGLLLDDAVITSLLFLPVLALFLGWPLVGLIGRRRSVPTWYAPVLAFLMGVSVTAALLAVELFAAPGAEVVIPAASAIAAVLNAMQLPLALRSAGGAAQKARARLDRKRAAAASCFVILLALVAFTMVQPFPSKPLTEFYLLNENGGASGMPYQATVGGKINLTVGVANHEGRTVQYHVQVWMARLGSAADPNSTEAMYYLDNLTVELDHTPMPLSGQWVPQYEFNSSLNVTMDGTYRLWFFLFFDEVPSELDGLIPADRLLWRDDAGPDRAGPGTGDTQPRHPAGCRADRGVRPWPPSRSSRRPRALMQPLQSCSSPTSFRPTTGR